MIVKKVEGKTILDITLSSRIIQVAYDIELMKYSEDYLLERIADAPNKETKEHYSRIYNEYTNNKLDFLVSETAKRTGGDPDQIRNPETRTEEQQKIMLEISGAELVGNLFAIVNSNYASALYALSEIKDERPEETTQDEQRVFLYYYFATRPDIELSKQGYYEQHPEEIEILVNQYKQFRAFVAEKYNDGSKKEVISVLEAFDQFINPNNNNGEPISEKKVEPSKISRAIDEGAITSLGGHVATIAINSLQDSFTNQKMKNLPGLYTEFKFENDGRLSELSLNGQPLQPLDEIHTAFLMTLLQYAEQCDIREYNSRDNPSVSIYLPSFYREAHIDPRPRIRDKQTGELVKRERKEEQTISTERLDRFLEFLAPLDNRVGYIKGEGYYTVARFISYDEKLEIVRIAIPYEIKLVEMARLHSDRHSAISTIFHADIMTENQTAVELANRIAVGVIERGVTRAQESTYKNEEEKKTPEASNVPKQRIFRWDAKFSTLISDCPQLQRELAVIRYGDFRDKPQRINKKLKDTFEAAIRIITQKSDMPDYYLDLTIKTGKLKEFRAPTNSTLNDKLVITYKGKNPNYDK